MLEPGDFGEDFGGDVLSPAEVAAHSAFINAKVSGGARRILGQIVQVFRRAPALGLILHLAHPNREPPSL